MRVLIVRLSSMGDMVHTLPAVSDAAKSIPGLTIDWAVDQAFAEIPRWHRSVECVIPCPPRSQLWRSMTNGELRRFTKTLRETKYDLVIDVQTEIKSAVVTRIARGVRCGYDHRSVHEWGAQFAYQKKFSVKKTMHSITRMRRLVASALGYPVPESEPDYGIDRSRLKPIQGFRKPYLVFVHCTSWVSKNWDEESWRRLSEMSAGEGFSILLPWGNEAERQRAERIASGNSHAIVLPPTTIGEKASLIAEAAATVGSDTGLSHIAAALDIPSVTLYGPTDPDLIGATGRNQAHLASEFECVKCHKSRCVYPNQPPDEPACLAVITPDRVMAELKKLVQPVKV